MTDLKPCPFCGGKVEIDMLDSENSRNVKIYSAVHCPECHEWFFKGLSRGKIIERWNRRAQPENKPLTLEELRRMDGQPVWVTFLDDVFTIGHTAPLWMIVNAEEKEFQAKNEYVCFSDIGCIAYPSKPKGRE